MPLELLQRMYGDSSAAKRDGVLPIIAISFCALLGLKQDRRLACPWLSDLGCSLLCLLAGWLTPAHPDPEGKQLATIAATLEREQAKYAKANFADMGVFWGERAWMDLKPAPRHF